ncbi:hypothetical protein ACQKLP_16920 [Chitinophaga sp. NPDC101104]|uniref:hypothetical protein n=1 Tax=Chitinophaga sp. NPDC101104 TaxID=3390561 RepID=UPI003CFCD08B
MQTLLDFMKRIPAVRPEIANGTESDGTWWIKFSLDVRHDLAWNVVQELGHVCNWLSVDERLPTRFYPVSAPPYLNGGPEDFLYWIIASTEHAFSPALALEWLEGRLPNPVDDLENWNVD